MKDALKPILPAIIMIIVAIMIVFVVRSNVQNGAVGGDGADVVDWALKDSAILRSTSAAFPEDGVGERSKVSVLKQADVTGDGIPEALVDLGNGGASTDYVSLVRHMNDGAISVARWKDVDGSIGPVRLLAGAAVLHSDDPGMIPEMKAIYQRETAYRPEDGGLSSCSVTAYVWKGSEELFSYDPDLSLTLSADLCSASGSSIQ